MSASASSRSHGGSAEEAQDSFLAIGEIRSLIARLSALISVQGVPAAVWRDEIERSYASRRRSTRLRMRQAVSIAVDLLGEASTTAGLTGPFLDQFAAAIRPGRRAATQAGLLRALRAACRIAIARGWLAQCPFVGWRGWPCEWREPPLKSRRIDSASIRAILHTLASRRDWPGMRLFALASVFAYCGLRLREALNMRWVDLDFERRVISIPRFAGLKTRSSESLAPMPDSLADVLSAWKPHSGSDWCFPALGRDRPWIGGKYGSRPTEQLRDFARSLGIDGVTPHTLRHSLASELADRGFSARSIQLILRHSKPSTQNYYVHQEISSIADSMRTFRY